jgi:hypothetical protein
MTDIEILSWFQENNPKTLAEINAAGIEADHIGSGGACDVYELVGTPWAVKIQKQGSTRGYDDEVTPVPQQNLTGKVKF